MNLIMEVFTKEEKVEGVDYMEVEDLDFEKIFQEEWNKLSTREKIAYRLSDHMILTTVGVFLVGLIAGILLMQHYAPVC